MHKSLFLFFLALAVWMACKKDPDPSSGDYRDKFVGQYSLHKTGTVTSGLNGYTVDTIITTTLSKSGDTHISLLDADIKLTTEGRFGAFNTGDCAVNPVDNYYVFCGYLKQDSLVFETYQGSPSANSQFRYAGVKQ